MAHLYKKLVFVRPFIGNIFYNRGGQSGLIDNYWSLESKNLKLEPKTEYNFGTTKTITKRLNLRNNCLEDKEIEKAGYDHVKCVETYLINLLKQKLTENGKKLCWIPQAEYFFQRMKETKIEACQTIAEMEFVSNETTKVMILADKKNPECPVPCTVDTVKITERNNPILASNSSATELFIYWDTLEVSIEEEYLLFDFNAIVSAVGGSLGLFLGFSCLDFLLKLMAKVEVTLFKNK
jgi:hypothetical protein